MNEVISRLCMSIENSIWVREKGFIPHLVVNPYAGTFKNAKLLKKIKTALVELSGGAWDQAFPSSVHIYSSEEAGHARDFAKELVELYPDKSLKHLVVIAAGDGTSHEVLSGLLAFPEICSSVYLFRLPLGTGNDGADCNTVLEAVDVWGGKAVIKAQDTIVTQTASGQKYFAFNIASFGLDAYVTDMTNKIKKIMPGSFYSLMVDVASLLYEPVYKVKTMNIMLENGLFVEDKILFAAMGVTGHRTYGDHKKILPDGNNFCATRTMSLLKKISRKGMFYAGTHIQLEEVKMGFFDACIIDYPSRIPFQADGETWWFDKSQFPASMKLVKTGLSCIRHPSKDF